MDKINYEKKLSEGLYREKILKNFFKQIYQNKKKANNISIEDVTLDPRIEAFYVYCVCSNQEIKKLMELGEEYLKVNTSVVKIDNLKRHKTMEYNVYNIEVNEDSFRTYIRLCIIEETNFIKRDEYVKDVIIAQDRLAYAKRRLDFFDVQF